MKMQNIENRCYKTGKYTVCGRVRVSFSPKILQAGAVKGLILTTTQDQRRACACMLVGTEPFPYSFTLPQLLFPISPRPDSDEAAAGAGENWNSPSAFLISSSSISGRIYINITILLVAWPTCSVVNVLLHVTYILFKPISLKNGEIFFLLFFFVETKTGFVY